MKSLFINPKVASFQEGLSPDQFIAMKKVVSQSETLKRRLSFSQKAFSGLGLLTAAAVGGKALPDMEIHFRDENMESAELCRWLSDGYDLIALGGTVYQMNRMLAIIHEAQHRSIPVVVGGAAVMTFPDIFARKGVSLILGESEDLFPRFLTDFLGGDTKTTYVSESDSGVDLAVSPIPDYSLAAKYDYTFIGVQTTRGCPLGCGFCQVSQMLGDRYRHKAIDRIIEEIKVVKAIWPGAFFFFYDNNLFANRIFCRALFQKMAAENIDLGRWGTNTDASIYKDHELLDLASSRGSLDYLGIGFESLSETSIKTIGNPLKVKLQEEYATILNTLKEKGIAVFAYFMFGFEDSRPEDLEKIVDFIHTHKINGQISQLVPMPGTPLYDGLRAEYRKQFGTIRKGPMGEWNLIRQYLLDKSSMSKSEMTGLLVAAYSRIYDDTLHGDEELIPAPFI